MLHDLSPSTVILPYKADWDTVFVDNFDDVSSLDNWTPKTTPRGHQLCLFQDSIRNISIDTTEGKLYITPIKENVIYNAGGNYQKQYYYTSGELISNAEFRFGYFEIRCKLPRFKGAHPAFWLFSGPQDTLNDALELDIFESSSSNPMETRRNSFTTNYTQYNNPNNNTCTDNSCMGFFINNDEPTNTLSDKFYTYALEWTPNELTYYIDNRIIRRVSIDTLNSLIHAMYPCHIRICTEIDWWNPPDEETQLEPFIIDYIRVYQKDSYIPKPEINGNEIVTYDDWNTYYVENPNPNSTYTWEIDENGELNIINPNSVQVRLKPDSTTAVLTLKEELDGNIATNQKIITNRLPTEFRAAVNYWVCNNPYTQLEVQHNDQNNLPSNITNLINKFELFEADILGDKKTNNPIYTIQNNDITSAFKINDYVIPDSTYVVEHELSSDKYYSKSRRVIYPTLNSAFCPIVWYKDDPKNIWAKSIVSKANNLWKLYQCNLTGTDDSLIYQVDIPPRPPHVPHLDFCYYLNNQQSDYYYLDHTTYLENNNCFPDKTRRMYFYTKDAEDIDTENINCYIPFRKYPYILLKEDTVTIMWQLYSILNCTFYYKKSDDPEFIEVQVNEPYADYFLYKYELTNLDPGVLYDFKVVVNDTYPCEKTGSFISPPDSSETQISFYGYGDTRGDDIGGEPPFHDSVCSKVLDEINEDSTSQTLIIHTGDWNFYDTEEMWDAQYFLKDNDNAVELRTKIGVVGCIGNHEGEDCGTNAPNFRKYWPYDYPVIDSFWHSYDYGPVHFCFADQRKPGQTLGNPDIQKHWIKKDLEESNKPWKVLVFHPPVYTCAQDPNNFNSEIEFFDSLLNDPEKYGVNMVLNGHVHKYSDWLVNGVHHLTLGGGGASKDEEDTLKVVDPNNPNIIRYQKNWHFAKFEVHNDYIKVKIPYWDDKSSWDTLDEFIIPHSFIIDSGENIVWEDHGCHYYADSIRVKTGGILTIKGDVEFQRDGGIIVEPGGKLILDNALLTCLGDYVDYNDYESYWQGIQVWGNSSASQWPDTSGICQQGYLELHNATIENAVCAVELWRPDHWGTQGGIIYADSSIFRNNAKSVHALHYTNFDPYNIDREMNYRAGFKHCTFEITKDYAGDYTFYKHIDLSQVKGIHFYACNFTLDKNAEGVSEWNSGIAAYNAGFSVYPVCNSNTIPCSDYDKCTFNGFYSAINATSIVLTTNTFSVNRAVFNNNIYG
ncbi:MAG: family 16 glycosylhydrolase, partial [Bacteroidales bacterium]|nr:family 16 glycosylhydrolase [Bacteroidales bacterium]